MALILALLIALASHMGGGVQMGQTHQGGGTTQSGTGGSSSG